MQSKKQERSDRENVVRPTPTPYQVLQGQTVRGTPDAFTISYALENGSEDVKTFIVRAVNSHEELVQFAKNYHQVLISQKLGHKDRPNCCSVTKATVKAEGLE